MSARPARLARPSGSGGRRGGPGRRGTAAGLAGLLLLPGAVVGVQVAGTGAALAALDTTLYAVASNVLYRVDEATGATTALPGTLPFNTNAAARQPGSDLIFFVEAASTARVGTYNVVTGAMQTLTGTVPASFTRLAFRSDGRLFGMADNTLYELNVSSGAVVTSSTVTGTLPSTGGGDLAFTPDNDAYVIVGSTLYHMNAPYTTATTVGPVGNANAHPSLAFGSNGRLWTAGSSGSTSSDVGYLNIGTGAETNVSSTSGFTFSDMASAPDRKPVVSGTATASTAYATPVHIDVSSYLSDPDGDPLRVVSVDGGLHGTGSVDGSGRPVFTPAPGFSGPTTITYVVSDGVGGQATGSIDVVVGNATPEYTAATRNTAQTISRGTLPAPVTAADPNGEPLGYTLTSGTLPPGVSLTAAGSFTGSALTAGRYTATITATDPHGASATTTLVVTVTPHPPAFTAAATNTTQTVPRGATPVPVVATDPDNDPLTYTLTGGALPGDVVLTGSGAFTGSPTSRGTSTVTITVTDSEGASDTTALVLTVPNTTPAFTATPGNTAQTLVQGDIPAALGASDDDGDAVTFTVTSGQLPAGLTLQSSGAFTGTASTPGSYDVTVTIDDGHGGTTTGLLHLQVNAAGAPSPRADADTTPAGADVDTDVLGNDTDPGGYPLAVTAVTPPAHGTAVRLPSGAVRYTPDPGWSGPDSYTYTVDNARGGTATGTVTITTTPLAVGDAASTTGPQRVDLHVLTNDLGTLDPATVAVSSAPGHGTVTPDSAGVLSYTPAVGFTGTDTFTYQATDQAGATAHATVTVTVTAPAAPNAADLTSTGVGTAPQSRTATVPVGGTAALLQAGTPATAVSALSVAGQGSWVLDPTSGQITFTPTLGFTGPATTVTYRVTDAYGQTAQATYTATVTPPAPPAPAGLTSTGTGTTPQSQHAPAPTGGSVTLLDGLTPVTTLTVPHQGTYLLNPATGALTFTPVLGFTGPAQPAHYQLTDAYGQTGRATYTPTVTPPAPPAPGAVSSTGTGTDRQSQTVPVPTGGSITLLTGTPATIPGTTLTSTGQGTYTLDPSTGTILFTPVLGFTGPEPPRLWWRHRTHEKVASCQHRGSTRTSCVSGRSGSSPRPASRNQACRCMRRSSGSVLGSGSSPTRCAAGASSPMSTPVAARGPRRVMRRRSRSWSGRTAS